MVQLLPMTLQTVPPRRSRSGLKAALEGRESLFLTALGRAMLLPGTQMHPEILATKTLSDPL